MEIAAEVFGQPRSHVTNSTSFFRQRTENIQFNVFAKPILTQMLLRSKCSISCSGKQGLTAASTRPPIKLAAGYADLVGRRVRKVRLSVEHMSQKLKRGKYRSVILAALLLGLCRAGQVQPALGAAPSATAAAGAVTLFQNVRIFDGKSGTLSGSRNVLVRGNKIESIATGPIPTDPSAATVLIDGGGRTLMPGLIDMHWHTMMVRPTPAQLLTADIGYLNLVAGAEATDTLMRGFTTVRDVGGPAFGLKRAIDEGAVAGPRIFPSGAMITVTSGHGDFRQPFEVPRTLGAPQSRVEQLGAAMIADSPDEVRVRVREQLML